MIDVKHFANTTLCVELRRRTHSLAVITSSLTRVPNVDTMSGYFFGSDCIRVLTTSMGINKACAVDPQAAPHAANLRKTPVSKGRSFSTGYLMGHCVGVFDDREGKQGRQAIEQKASMIPRQKDGVTLSTMGMVSLMKRCRHDHCNDSGINRISPERYTTHFTKPSVQPNAACSSQAREFHTFKPFMSTQETRGPVVKSQHFDFHRSASPCSRPI